ncbi:large ribosomal subunit protein uL15m-like isoform X3 [Artemia franciscana]|uniref:large ribosomal subunit protein uL15m-like isoform X3 n=1 Tax=Artemia franciscana TaxID=6661 RepID=UPI0032DBDDBB
MTSSGVDKALSLVRNLPRISFNNLRDSVGKRKPRERCRGRYGGKTHGCGQKGSEQRQAYMRLGHGGGQNPFYMRFSKEPYYKGWHLQREYLPISLHRIQMLIDTGRLNPEEPIDVTQICNTKLFKLDPRKKQYGFQITDEGADCFDAKINLEVQYAPEHVIAAVEKNGGIITTAFYDAMSLQAAVDPEAFFNRGVPIPKRMLPPHDALVQYSDPKQRGYLADPDKIAEERFI